MSVARWVMVVVTSMVMMSTRARIIDYCANIDYCGEGVDCDRQPICIEYTSFGQNIVRI